MFTSGTFGFFNTAILVVPRSCLSFTESYLERIILSNTSSVNFRRFSSGWPSNRENLVTSISYRPQSSGFARFWCSHVIMTTRCDAFVAIQESRVGFTRGLLPVRAEMSFVCTHCKYNDDRSLSCNSIVYYCSIVFFFFFDVRTMER